MSNEEQNAMVGRLLRELSDKKKELALVRAELALECPRLDRSVQPLGHKAVDGDPAEARAAVAELLARESLERARTLLDDVERLPPASRRSAPRSKRPASTFEILKLGRPFLGEAAEARRRVAVNRESPEPAPRSDTPTKGLAAPGGLPAPRTRLAGAGSSRRKIGTG